MWSLMNANMSKLQSCCNEDIDEGHLFKDINDTDRHDVMIRVIFTQDNKLFSWEIK